MDDVYQERAPASRCQKARNRRAGHGYLLQAATTGVEICPCPQAQKDKAKPGNEWFIIDRTEIRRVDTQPRKPDWSLCPGYHKSQCNHHHSCDEIFFLQGKKERRKTDGEADEVQDAEEDIPLANHIPRDNGDAAPQCKDKETPHEIFADKGDTGHPFLYGTLPADVQGQSDQKYKSTGAGECEYLPETPGYHDVCHTKVDEIKEQVVGDHHENCHSTDCINLLVSCRGFVPGTTILLHSSSLLLGGAIRISVMNQDDEHIIEAAGCARVVVRNGQVVSVGPAGIQSCPLAARFREPVKTFSEEEIRRNIEGRIASFGMCTPDRQVESDDDFVLFGASELLSTALRSGIIDAAVIACDGAGTVIATTPRLIQGIGGKMSGLVSTTPIPAVIERITAQGGIVVSPHDAALNAENGVRRALENGFHAPAVTTASADEAVSIRSVYPSACIVAVHTTGTNEQGAEKYAASCDLIFPCASRAMYEIAGKRAFLQGGKAVPVFAMTATGKKVVLAKIADTDTPVVIAGRSLPYSEGKEPFPLQ